MDTKIADSEIATFLNPPVQEIAAVKTKEKGQRVSIKGTVERVSVDKMNHHITSLKIQYV